MGQERSKRRSRWMSGSDDEWSQTVNRIHWATQTDDRRPKQSLEKNNDRGDLACL